MLKIKCIKTSVGKTQREEPRDRQKRLRKDNIKMKLTRIGCKSVIRIKTSQYNVMTGLFDDNREFLVFIKGREYHMNPKGVST